MKGCEDVQLMASITYGNDLSDEEILRINSERETYAVSCMVDGLQGSADPYAVFVVGGAHNLSQEIEKVAEGVGYIVITPDSYPKEDMHYSLD